MKKQWLFDLTFGAMDSLIIIVAPSWRQVIEELNTPYVLSALEQRVEEVNKQDDIIVVLPARSRIIAVVTKALNKYSFFGQSNKLAF